MPFSVKVKGKVHVPVPSTTNEVTDAPTEPFPYDSKDHAEAIAWAAYISMAAARQAAIDLYHEHEKLGEEIDERRNHPKVGVALNKLAKLQDKINKKQLEYLKQERVANYVWRTLSVRDREYHNLHLWFNTPAERAHLYGSWERHFEACPSPPKRFHLQESPLMLVQPDQKSEYIRVRMGGDYYDPTGES